MLLAYAVLVWALIELFGVEYGTVGAVSGAVGPAGTTWWQLYRTRELRQEANRAARALAAHRDPGPEHRAAADARARVLLAKPRSDEWLPGAMLLALAVACLVVALHRHDLAVALPAAPLVVLAVAITLLTRQRLLAASRWLDDPPFDREQA